MNRIKNNKSKFKVLLFTIATALLFSGAAQSSLAMQGKDKLENQTNEININTASNQTTPGNGNLLQENEGNNIINNSAIKNQIDEGVNEFEINTSSNKNIIDNENPNITINFEQPVQDQNEIIINDGHVNKNEININTASNQNTPSNGNLLQENEVNNIINNNAIQNQIDEDVNEFEISTSSNKNIIDNENPNITINFEQPVQDQNEIIINDGNEIDLTTKVNENEDAKNDSNKIFKKSNDELPVKFKNFTSKECEFLQQIYSFFQDLKQKDTSDSLYKKGNNFFVNHMASDSKGQMASALRKQQEQIDKKIDEYCKKINKKNLLNENFVLNNNNIFETLSFKILNYFVKYLDSKHLLDRQKQAASFIRTLIDVMIDWCVRDKYVKDNSKDFLVGFFDYVSRISLDDIANEYEKFKLKHHVQILPEYDKKYSYKVYMEVAKQFFSEFAQNFIRSFFIPKLSLDITNKFIEKVMTKKLKYLFSKIYNNRNGDAQTEKEFESLCNHVNDLCNELYKSAIENTFSNFFVEEFFKEYEYQIFDKVYTIDDSFDERKRKLVDRSLKALQLMLKETGFDFLIDSDTDIDPRVKELLNVLFDDDFKKVFMKNVLLHNGANKSSIIDYFLTMSNPTYLLIDKYIDDLFTDDDEFDLRFYTLKFIWSSLDKLIGKPKESNQFNKKQFAKLLRLAAYYSAAADFYKFINRSVFVVSKTKKNMIDSLHGFEGSNKHITFEKYISEFTGKTKSKLELNDLIALNTEYEYWELNNFLTYYLSKFSSMDVDRSTDKEKIDNLVKRILDFLNKKFFDEKLTFNENDKEYKNLLKHCNVVFKDEYKECFEYLQHGYIYNFLFVLKNGSDGCIRQNIRIDLDKN